MPRPRDPWALRRWVEEQRRLPAGWRDLEYEAAERELSELEADPLRLGTAPLRSVLRTPIGPSAEPTETERTLAGTAFSRNPVEAFLAFDYPAIQAARRAEGEGVPTSRRVIERVLSPVVQAGGWLTEHLFAAPAWAPRLARRAAEAVVGREAEPPTALARLAATAAAPFLPREAREPEYLAGAARGLAEFAGEQLSPFNVAATALPYLRAAAPASLLTRVARGVVGAGSVLLPTETVPAAVEAARQGRYGTAAMEAGMTGLAALGLAELLPSPAAPATVEGVVRRMAALGTEERDAARRAWEQRIRPQGAAVRPTPDADEVLDAAGVVVAKIPRRPPEPAPPAPAGPQVDPDLVKALTRKLGSAELARQIAERVAAGQARVEAGPLARAIGAPGPGPALPGGGAARPAAAPTPAPPMPTPPPTTAAAPVPALDTIEEALAAAQARAQRRPAPPPTPPEPLSALLAPSAGEPARRVVFPSRLERDLFVGGGERELRLLAAQLGLDLGETIRLSQDYQAVASRLARQAPPGGQVALPEAQTLPRPQAPAEAARPAPPPAAPPERPLPTEGPAEDPLQRLLQTVEQAKTVPGPEALADPLRDPLTGLPNRLAYEGLERRRPRGAGGTIVVDLDNFKAINDTLGHEAGNRALQVVADALRRTVREGDAYRLHGDEFVVTLKAGQAEQAAERIESVISRALEEAGFGEVGGRRVAASAAAGRTLEEADRAMFARKRERGVSQPREQGPAAPSPEATAPEVARAAAASPYDVIDPMAVEIDAGTYQFKSSGPRGETGRLAHVERWDPLAGRRHPIIVHERLDGRRFVADGHQRVNLAQRLIREGKEVPPLTAVVLREADGWTVPTVRRAAALLNIQEGSASPIDIAKAIREAPLEHFERAALPKDADISGTRLRQAEALAKLDEPAFQMVATGEVPVEQAVAVGKLVADPAQQVAALRALARERLENAYQAEQFVRALQAEGYVTETQVDLFGEQTIARSLAKEKAQILDAARRAITGAKRTFGTVEREASRLTEAGNVLARETNRALAERAARHAALLEQFAHTRGQTSEVLHEAARQVAAGRISPADAVPGILDALEADFSNAQSRATVGAPSPPRSVPPPDEGVGRAVPASESIGPTIAPPSRPAEAPSERATPAAAAPELPEATPAEAQDILRELARQIEEAEGTPVAEAPFRLEAPPAPAPAPQPRQISLEDLLRPEPEAPVPRRAPPAEAPEGPGPAREAVVSAETRPPMKQAPLGQYLAPPDKDYLFIKVHPETARANPTLRTDLMAAGYKYRPKQEAWFKTIRRERGQTMEQARLDEEDAARSILGVPLDQILDERAARASVSPTPPPPPREPAPAPRTVPRNVRDFLVRQLRYTPEEVDAMGAEAAVALGERVRQHPGGVAAGIAAYRKAPAEIAPAPAPEESLAALAEALGVPEFEPEAIAMRRALQRPVPRREGAPVGPSAGPPPEPTPRQRVRTEQIKREIAHEPEPGPVRSVEEARAEQARIKAEAAERNRLLDNPTPENLDEYMRRFNDAAARAWRRLIRGGTGKAEKLPRVGPGGELLLAGFPFGPIQVLAERYPEYLWPTVRMAGAGLFNAILADAEADQVEPSWLFQATGGRDPLVRFLMGAAAGWGSPALARRLKSAAPAAYRVLRETLTGPPRREPPLVTVLRQARERARTVRDVPATHLWRQPHEAVPDAWARLEPALERLGALEGAAGPVPLVDALRRLYREELTSEFRALIREADQAGLRNRALYLRAMAGAFHGSPTALERLVQTVVSAGTLGAVRPDLPTVRRALNGFERAIAWNLFSFAYDTGLLNKTQLGLLAPYVQAKDLARAVRLAATPQGQAATAFLRGEYHAQQAKVPSKTLRLLLRAAQPLRATDVSNAEQAYLAVQAAARRQGLNAADAHEVAVHLTNLTQGVPGELGANPFLRHVGPLRLFTKYPTIWAQWLDSFVRHPDPRVRLRGAAYLLGVPTVLGALGINPLYIIAPTLPLAPVALRGLNHAMAHALGRADHPLARDLDITGPGGGGVLPRWPVKLYREVQDWKRYGAGRHPEYTPAGEETGGHSGLEGLLRLIGLEATGGGVLGATGVATGERRQMREAREFAARAQRLATSESGELRRRLRQALEAGDEQAVEEILGQLTPEQVRGFMRREALGPAEVTRRRVPRKYREQFEQQFRQLLEAR